jgi:hypothetical protein
MGSTDGSKLNSKEKNKIKYKRNWNRGEKSFAFAGLYSIWENLCQVIKILIRLLLR